MSAALLNRRKKPLPDVEYMRRYFRYDPESGVIYRIMETAGNVERPGSRVVGRKTRYGYLEISLYNEDFLAHRLAWALQHGKWPSKCLDHINGDRGDNRISNLREVTVLQNNLNVGVREGNKSGYKGVHWNKEYKRWVAGVSINGVRHRIGKFRDLEMAAEAVRSLREKIHGEYANHGEGGGTDASDDVSVKSSSDVHGVEVGCMNTSGVVGVSWHNKEGKWRTQVTVGGKRHYGRECKELADAVVAVRELRERLYGGATVHTGESVDDCATSASPVPGWAQSIDAGSVASRDQAVASMPSGGPQALLWGGLAGH